MIKMEHLPALHPPGTSSEDVGIVPLGALVTKQDANLNLLPGLG